MTVAWAGASSSENEEEQTVARDILEAEWTGISGGWKRGKRQVLRLTIWLQNPSTGIPHRLPWLGPFLTWREMEPLPLVHYPTFIFRQLSPGPSSPVSTCPAAMPDQCALQGR